MTRKLPTNNPLPKGFLCPLPMQYISFYKERTWLNAVSVRIRYSCEWQKPQINSSLNTQDLILSLEKSKVWQSRAWLAVPWSYQDMVFSQLLAPSSLGCVSHACNPRWLLKLWLLCHFSRQQKGKRGQRTVHHFPLRTRFRSHTWNFHLHTNGQNLATWPYWGTREAGEYSIKHVSC